MSSDSAAQVILHITTVDAWLNAVRRGEYRAESLATEGFIHASTPEQAPATALRYYAGREDLVILAIDPERLKPDLRWEVATGGQQFPHIYGALNLDAVRQALLFPPTLHGAFELPAGLIVDTSLQGIWVVAENLDGSPHWQHPALLVAAEEGRVITRTSYSQQVARQSGAFTSVFNTRGHYWPDRWYNVIRLERPDGTLDGFYCNIASPVRFDGRTLRYADLELDVRVFVSDGGNMTSSLLDEDEFEAARKRYGYPDEVVENARRAVDEVCALVASREPPFDT